MKKAQKLADYLALHGQSDFLADKFTGTDKISRYRFTFLATEHSVDCVLDMELYVDFPIMGGWAAVNDFARFLNRQLDEALGKDLFETNIGTTFQLLGIRQLKKKTRVVAPNSISHIRRMFLIWEGKRKEYEESFKKTAQSQPIPALEVMASSEIQ